MRKCPSCGADYDVLDAICPTCGAELPAPYENAPDDDGYDTGEFPNPVQHADDEDTSIHFVDGSSWQVAGRAALPSQLTTILSGAEVHLTDKVLSPGTVILAQGRVVEVLDEALPDPQDGATFIDLTGKILAPGFIDLHVHGMMGIDTNEASTADFQRLAVEAAKHGITALVPTTVACPLIDLSRILINFHAARAQGTTGARLLGLHLESNFISPHYAGAQPPSHIFPPDDTQAWQIRQVIDEYTDDIRIVTIAPEVSGALDMIQWLVERNIVASLGHSAADYDQASAGFDAGARHATHLFNAMPPLHHRQPGLVGAALERDEVFTELICDGIHLHPAIISTVISAKGADRVMAVSDGLQGAGMDSGAFQLGGQRVMVQHGVAQLENGTIAGSVVTMDGIVRVMVEHVGWDLNETFLMAATTPAESLGLTQVGRIAPGAAADLVVLDDELQVAMTFVNGRTVYQR